MSDGSYNTFPNNMMHYLRLELTWCINMAEIQETMFFSALLVQDLVQQNASYEPTFKSF